MGERGTHPQAGNSPAAPSPVSVSLSPARRVHDASSLYLLLSFLFFLLVNLLDLFPIVFFFFSLDLHVFGMSSSFPLSLYLPSFF